MPDLDMKLRLAPELDVERLNVLIAALKKSLGPLGDAIKPVDAKALQAELAKLQQPIAKAKEEAQKLTEEMTKAGTKFSKAFEFNQVVQGVAAVSSAVTQLSQPFIALDTATQKIKTLGGDAAGLADTFRESAVSLSNTVPISAAEIQNATYEALSAGIAANEEAIGQFMDASAKLAIGGGETIASAVNVLSSQLNAYGLQASETAKTSDILFNTINVGKTSLPELASSLANVVPTAASMGVELEAVGGALALMTAKGIPTAQSTSKLNQLLIELQKPAANLAPVLAKAGISLESLKKDDLPVSLRKVDKAMKELGLSAVQAFGSSEASAAFNTLTGDLDQLDSFFEGVRDTTGSTELAYEKMASGIENSSNQMLNQVSNFIDKGIGALGPSFIATTSAAAKLAPTLTTLTQLPKLIPDVGKIKDAAVSIATKLVPSLFVQTAATTGATAATTALNTAVLFNPITGAIVTILALGAALKFISAAMQETAQERLDDKNAEIELLEVQKKSVKERFNQVSSHDELLASYKRLSETENKTAKQEEQLRRVVGEVALSMDSSIDVSKSYADNQAAVAEASEKTRDEIAKVGAELFNLDKQLQEAQVVKLNLEAEVATDDLEEVLSDNMGEGILGSLNQVRDGVRNFFVDGSGFTDEAAKGFVGSFKDKIFNAKTQGDISKAAAEAIEKVKINADQLGLSKEEQAQVVKSISDTATKAGEALKAEQEKNAKIQTDLKNGISATFDELIDAGSTTEDAIKRIAKEFKVTGEEAKNLGIAGELDKATAAGKLSQVSVDELSTKYGKSKDEVQQMVDKQKLLTNEVGNTTDSVAQLAAGFEAAKTEQGKQRDQAQKELAALIAKEKELKQANSGATAEQIANNKKLQAETLARGRAADIELDANEAITKQAQEAIDPVTKKKKEAKSFYETQKAAYELERKSYENALRQSNIQEEAGRLASGRKKDITDEIALQERSAEVNTDALAAFRKAFQNADGSFLPQLKGKDLADAKQQLIDLNAAILEDKNKLAEIKLKFDPDELKRKLREFFIEDLSNAVKNGTEKAATLIKELETDLEGTRKKLAALPEGASEERIKLLTEERTTQKEIRDLRLSDVELRIKALDEARKRELDKVDDGNEELLRHQEAFTSAFARVAELGVSQEADGKLAALEKQHEDEILSDEQFAAEKEAVAKEAAARLRSIQSAEQGAQLLAQVSADATRLESERAYLAAKLTLAQEAAKVSGDFSETKSLGDQLDKVKKDIEEKGSLMGSAMTAVKDNLSSITAELLAGDPEAAKEGMKAFLSLIVGFLEKLLAASIIEIVLGSTPLKALAGTFGFAAPIALAGFTALIGAGIRAAVGPLLSGIAAFPTGAVFNSPTLAMVGDGARLGGDNTEVLLRNSQIQAIIAESVQRQNLSVVAAIMHLTDEVRDLQFRFYLSGNNLTTAMQRTLAQNNRRNRNLPAYP